MTDPSKCYECKNSSHMELFDMLFCKAKQRYITDQQPLCVFFVNSSKEINISSEQTLEVTA